MELTLVPLLLPVIQAEFGLSISQLAWVFNSYGIAVAVGVLLGGWLGDVFDTWKVFGVGVLFFATGSAFVAFAGVYETILVARALQGFGGGIFSPLVPLLLTRALPHQPGKVLIVWGSVAGYVAAFAPYFYGSVLGGYGWNLAFMVFAAVAVIALVIIYGFAAREKPAAHHRSRPKYSRLLESRELWVLFGYVFCTYGAITYYLFRLPLLLAGNDFPVASIGLTLSIMWLSFSFISTLLRNWVDEPHVRRIMLAAPIFIGAGFSLPYFCHALTCLIISAMLVGSGLACSNAPSTQLVLKYAPKGMSAVSASLDITFARLGGVATVAILAQTMFGFAAISIVVMCMIAFVCALEATNGVHEH